MKNHRSLRTKNNRLKKNGLAIYIKTKDSIVLQVYYYFDIKTYKKFIDRYYDFRSQEVCVYRYFVVLDNKEVVIDESEYKRINGIILNKYNGNIID